MLKTLADRVPTNWVDPLLTGPDAVIGSPPYNCGDIERLLLAIAARIRTTERRSLPSRGRSRRRNAGRKVRRA